MDIWLPFESYFKKPKSNRKNNPMAQYIDGFVFPISRDRIDEYQQVAERVADIYKEHGALEYVEFVGDDLFREGTLPFPKLMSIEEGETVVFGWIVFDSRDTRDDVNKKVETDERMPELIAPLMDPNDPIFDPSRMAYGGFCPLI